MKKKFFIDSKTSGEQSLPHKSDVRNQLREAQKNPGLNDDSTTLNSFDLARCSSAEAREVIPFEHAVRMRILPIGMIHLLGRPVFSVVTPRCLDYDAIRSLRFITNCEIQQSIVPEPSLVLEAIHLAYKGCDDRLIEQVSHLAERKDSTSDQVNTSAELNPLEAGGSDVAAFLATLLEYASARQASDIHLFPTIAGTQIRLRIGGTLLGHEQAICSPHQHGELVRRIKVLSKLNTTETRLPQEGSFSFLLAKERIYARVSIMPTIHGEKVALRFTGNLKLLAMNQLGYCLHTLDFLEEVMAQDEGAIIVCGPTGSGKTTSIYSLLSELVKRNVQVVSIEDPVEIHLEKAIQSSVDQKQGFTYQAALKALLRQDPDVIFVGECRDSETAKTALQAALTGHLLLTTLHAKGVRECLSRLIEFGLEESILRQAISLVIYQRLFPMLCEHCKIYDLGCSRRMKIDVHRPVGCSRCEYSGFRGRLVVEEALRVTPRSLASFMTDEESFISKSPLYVSFVERERELINKGLIAAYRA